MSAMHAYDQALAVCAELDALHTIAEPYLSQQMGTRPNGEMWKYYSNMTFDPEQSLLHADQRRLYESYIAFEWPGLIRAIQKHCRRHYEEENQNKPLSKTDLHRHILNDEANPCMSALCAYMLPEMIEGLIHGNITSRCYEDLTYNVAIGSWGRKFPRPMIYVVEIVNVKYLDGKEQAFAGRLLNWHEWRQTVVTLRSYMENAEDMHENGVGASQLIEGIDNSFDNYHNAKHPFFITQSNREVHTTKLKQFLLAIEEQYIKPGQNVFSKDPQDARLSIPFKRIPREVGWGRHGENRAFNHHNAQSSNWLYSLFYHTIRHLFGEMRFEVKTYNATNVCCREDAPVAEYFCSELARSLWYQGGLNPYLPGGMATKNIPSRLFEGVQKMILDHTDYSFATRARVVKTQEKNKATLEAVSKETREATWVRLAAKQAEVKKQELRVREKAYARLVSTGLNVMQEFLEQNSMQKP